jgi:hypothetical protein
VDAKNHAITLVLGEHGGWRETGGDYIPTVTITGKSGFTKDREDVQQIMGTRWTPHNLAMHLRELPHLFADEASWTNAVAKLRNLNIKISKAVKDTSNEDTGEREKAIKLLIESGAEALEWNWKYAIYEGTDPVVVPAKILYEADENMSGIYVKVFNPRKVQQERKALEDMMANTISKIHASIGDALPFITLNGEDQED